MNTNNVINQYRNGYSFYLHGIQNSTATNIDTAKNEYFYIKYRQIKVWYSVLKCGVMGMAHF